MTTETMPAVAPERVTPLLPSEALRLGRLTHPRSITGAYFRPGAACALGAIYAGYGAAPDTDDGDRIDNRYMAREYRCPSCHVAGGGNWRTPNLVIHLNDYHHWSDDRIVAWLQGLGL